MWEWRTRTNQQQRAIWEEFFDSPAYRRACSEDPSYNLTEEDERRIILECFEVAPKIKKLEEEKYIRERMLEYHKNNNNNGVLITICIDQALDEANAIEAQYKIIEQLKKAKYKWLVEAEAVFEYWGDELQDPPTADLATNYKWNPHIHIIVKRTGKESVIRQNLIRKFVDKKLYGVYRIDVRKLDWRHCEDYVNGHKQEDKMDKVEMDMKTREKNKVNHKIIIDID